MTNFHERALAGEPVKDDSEKPKHSLLPVQPIDEIAQLLTFGAKKYGPYNYRGLAEGRMIDALMRHLSAYRRGEEVDPETGISHIIAVATNALMIRDKQVYEDPSLASLVERESWIQEHFGLPDAKPSTNAGRVVYPVAEGDHYSGIGADDTEPPVKGLVPEDAESAPRRTSSMSHTTPESDPHSPEFGRRS